MPEQIRLACEGLPGCRVVRALGVEAIGALPRFSIDVVCEDPGVDLAALLGAYADLAFGDDAGAVRTQALVVTDAAYCGSSRDGHRYALELSAFTYPLTLRSGYRIFQDKTTREIVTEVLTDAGIASSKLVFRLNGSYAAHVYCVQYGETDWGFVERLLATEGISYWFDHSDDDGPVIFFGDAPDAHQDMAGGRAIAFEDASGTAHRSSSFHELERVEELAFEGVHLCDYDIRQPNVLVEAKVGEPAREWFEFPACVPTAALAEARAAVRLEQLRRFHVHALGRTNSARLQPGRVLTLEGLTDEDLCGDYLVVEVRHEVQQSTRNDPRDLPYGNAVLLVPHVPDHAFRPELPRDVPRVHGLETALTTGAPGEEIHVDDLGSVKLHFWWDRSGIEDDHSSCWVRTLQMNMQGAMLLPRMRWEVPVVYFDGNPDAPFVLGRLYNGEAPVPYALPAHKTTSSLQSATSPGGAGSHETRFGDAAGRMETFIHATRDNSRIVGGSHLTTVTLNETCTVDKSHRIHVIGTQDVEVTGDQKSDVGGLHSIKVHGSRTELIGGMESISVKASRLLESSSIYGEAVGGMYGLLCNQSNTAVNGAMVQLIGGAVGLAAGLGMNETAAGARVQRVGGARIIAAARSVEDKTIGAKRIKSGAATITAAANIVSEVSSVGKLDVGGGAKIDAGGAVLFKAPSIYFGVGGTLLCVGGAKLEASGSATFSGGVLVLDTPTTEKQATSEVKA